MSANLTMSWTSRAYRHTRVLGYHPIVATRADTGEVLHIRCRTGKANTQRGVKRFVEELLAPVRRAGHAGRIVIRADSGLTNSTDVPVQVADIDHRDHASTELVIRDLKDQALCHSRPGSSRRTWPGR
jgi:hypothetical protein